MVPDAHVWPAQERHVGTAVERGLILRQESLRLELLRGLPVIGVAVDIPNHDHRQMALWERKVHALVSHVANRAIFAQAISLNAQGDKAIAKRLLAQARVMQIAYYDHLLQEHDTATS